MPTAKTIDEACRKGQFCYTGKRSQISGATSNYHGAEAGPGQVWVHEWKTGYWTVVPQSAVTITTEPFKQKKETPMD